MTYSLLLSGSNDRQGHANLGELGILGLMMLVCMTLILNFVVPISAFLSLAIMGRRIA